MVGRVAREVDGLRSHLANIKLLVVFQQLVKDPLVLGGVDAVSLAKEALHTSDVLADGHGWCLTLLLGQATLQVKGSRQMIGVRVCLQDPDNGVPLFGNQREEGVGRRGGDCPGAVVVVQDRVNDGGILGLWICDDILERACSCLEDGVNDGLDRRMVGLTGGRLPTPTAASDDGRERLDGRTKWCTCMNAPP